jgi:hypothetical protein
VSPEEPAEEPGEDRDEEPGIVVPAPHAPPMGGVSTKPPALPQDPQEPEPQPPAPVQPPAVAPDPAQANAPAGGGRAKPPAQSDPAPVASVPPVKDPVPLPAAGGPDLPVSRAAGVSLAMGLDAMSRQMGSHGSGESASVRAVRHTFVAITVGYVVWSLRGASLLASLLTSMPLWRSLDPLPILENRLAAANKKNKRRWFTRRGRGRGAEQPLREMVK